MDICQGNIPFDCVELVAPLSQPARSVSGGSKSVCFSPMFTCDIMLYRGCTVRMADTFSLVVVKRTRDKVYPKNSFLSVAKLIFERSRRKPFLIDVERPGGLQILYACTSSKLLEYIWGIYCSYC